MALVSSIHLETTVTLPLGFGAIMRLGCLKEYFLRRYSCFPDIHTLEDVTKEYAMAGVTVDNNEKVFNERILFYKCKGRRMM